jgi:hypothetical protein
MKGGGKVLAHLGSFGSTTGHGVGHRQPTNPTD